MKLFLEARPGLVAAANYHGLVYARGERNNGI
jgi:hypothetical protein